MGAVCRGSDAFVADGGEKGSISAFNLENWRLYARTAPQNGSIIALCLTPKVVACLCIIFDVSVCMCKRTRTQHA